jgi:hypothetical protein
VTSYRFFTRAQCFTLAFCTAPSVLVLALWLWRRDLSGALLSSLLGVNVAKLAALLVFVGAGLMLVAFLIANRFITHEQRRVTRIVFHVLATSTCFVLFFGPATAMLLMAPVVSAVSNEIASTEPDVEEPAPEPALPRSLRSVRNYAEAVKTGAARQQPRGGEK